MHRLEPKLDKHGLPIPGGFDDLDGARPRVPVWLRNPWVAGPLVVLILLSLGGVAFKRQLRENFGKTIAEVYLHQASKAYLEDDRAAALAALDSAIQWDPERSGAYELRCRVRLRDGDLDGSLADANALVERSPDYAPGYSNRSDVLQCLGRHDEALADADHAVELSSEGDSAMLNSRAYCRARANVDVEGALDDIDQALASDPEDAAMLDTRGWVYFRLGRLDEALADLDRAISLVETDPQWTVMRVRGPYFERSYNDNLSVMRRHRGEVHRELGNSDQAEADLRLAEQLGYNPAVGVW